ncbi:hypothetical protein [Trichocoleus sp. FACHB-90]|nr:hypothetical protein [Trichocoleus sp. FACHB-90]
MSKIVLIPGASSGIGKVQPNFSRSKVGMLWQKRDRPNKSQT